MVEIQHFKLDEAIVFGPFTLYPTRRLLQKDSASHRIGSRALDILIALVERAGEVVGKDELIARVWSGVTVEESSLRAHIKGLRRSLGYGENGISYVATVPGRGYCFVARIEQAKIGSHDLARRAAPVARTAVLKRMIGRDDVVRSLAAELLARRFVSVIGPGGVGKTTVAVAVVHELATLFEGAVISVDFSVLCDPKLVPSSVAAALGLKIHKQEWTSALLSYLACRRVLLFFDNCEHVIESVAALSEQIVGIAKQVHILVTSREALRVDGEHTHQLRPLEFPVGKRPLTAKTIQAFSAVALFLERAVASGAQIALSNSNAETVAECCRRLDGNPLAIELAASQVATHGLQGTAKMLDASFRLVWLGRRTANQRHQTLNALVEWSYDLLSEEERHCFRRLSAFVGDFDLAAAHAVAAEPGHAESTTLHIIERLGAKSLLTISMDQESPRYRLLETTRAFAFDKMTQNGEETAIARRHAEYFATLIERLLGCGGDGALGPGEAVANDNLGNIRGALGWSFSDAGDVEIGVRLAAAAASIFLELSLLGECYEWCARALKAKRQVGCDRGRELDLREALAIAGMFSRGNGADVQGAVLRGLELAEAVGNPMSQLRLLAGRHILSTRTANLHEAYTVAEQYDRIAKTVDDHSGRVTADWMLGIAHHLLGDQLEAQAHFDSGFARAANNPELSTKFFGYEHRIRAMVGLSRTLWLRGYPERAVRAAREAIHEASLLHSPIDECISLIYTAPVFLWRGDWPEASRTVERLVAHADQHSLTPYRAVGLGLLGELAVKRNDPDVGVKLLSEAVATLQAEHHHIQEAAFRGAAAEGLLQLGRALEAVEMIDEAIGQAELSGGFVDMPELVRIKGKILLGLSDSNVDQVRSMLTAAIEQCRKQSSLAWELRIAMDLAHLDQGLMSMEGRRLLAEILGRFVEGFDTADLQAARLCLLTGSQ
jgi:predicted ATPase/DNA-binding winged helix-turn-helix (wHTH) protein